MHARTDGIIPRSLSISAMLARPGSPIYNMLLTTDAQRKYHRDCCDVNTNKAAEKYFCLILLMKGGLKYYYSSSIRESLPFLPTRLKNRRKPTIERTHGILIPIASY